MAGNLFNQAMDKIRDEMAKHHDHAPLLMIGEHMTEALRRRPEAAEKILDKTKNLQGAYAALEAHAKGKARGKSGCVVISDQEGFEIAERYFGMDGEKAPEEAPPAPMKPLQEPAPFSGGIPDLDALLGL